MKNSCTTFYKKNRINSDKWELGLNRWWKNATTVTTTIKYKIISEIKIHRQNKCNSFYGYLFLFQLICTANRDRTMYSESIMNSNLHWQIFTPLGTCSIAFYLHLSDLVQELFFLCYSLFLSLPLHYTNLHFAIPCQAKTYSILRFVL